MSSFMPSSRGRGGASFLAVAGGEGGFIDTAR
jgi:hypothetical protein